ncbi:claudin-34-like [Hypomesus transpacificus]|uniref:claudin-34-like n=1 Tax=Hypomesus transpacificus TaxID=137520 RepID=UPI001F083406|nr:claudin-34-like [Hypomesus transpacificus]
MAYLVHTAHAQCLGLWVGTVGWILIGVTLGLVQWRVWQVDDLSKISSGVAWVGVWRVCFYSHVLVTPQFKVMYCQRMGLAEDYTPPEVAAAQVLMLVALGAGLCGNAFGVYGLRIIYFGLEKNAPIRKVFTAAGAFCLLAAMLALVPLLWNLNSVVTNQTIAFPEQFYMPQAPVKQHTGPAIGVGIVASMQLIASAVIFFSYRLLGQGGRSVEPFPAETTLDMTSHVTSLSRHSVETGRYTQRPSQARGNPAFQSDENL